jgi:predicted dehydrogenase
VLTRLGIGPVISLAPLRRRQEGPMDQPAPFSEGTPPGTSRPLRVGVVGCGFQGTALAKAAAGTAALRLVACADPDPAAAAGVAALAPGVSAHSSIEALLDRSAVDAVLVATPNYLLCPVSRAAIRAGKHVLAEKPIGLNAQEAATIEGEAARAGVRYMAGYSLRFWLARHVHDLLAAGVAGEIRALTGVFACPPLDDGWLGSPETGGGPLLFLGSHLVDMLLWFAGDEVAEVSGSIRRRADTGTDDTSAFRIHFGGGAVAQCLVTQAASTFFFTVDVIGNAGRVTLRGWHWLQFEIEVASTANAAYSQPTVISPYIASDHITMMLVPELEEFARAIGERRAPAITAADGRRVLQVLDAVVAADRRGASMTIGR